MMNERLPRDREIVHTDGDYSGREEVFVVVRDK